MPRYRALVEITHRSRTIAPGGEFEHDATAGAVLVRQRAAVEVFTLPADTPPLTPESMVDAMAAAGVQVVQGPLVIEGFSLDSPEGQAIVARKLAPHTPARPRKRKP
jgi:hypothetical protein